jgi:hypothetical protein
LVVIIRPQAVDVLHQEVVLVVAFLARVVHRVLLRVEVLDRVVVVVVVAAVDGLIGEVASRSQQRLSRVGPERDLVLMGERPKVRVSLGVAGVSQRSFQRLEVEDHRRVSYQFVQLKLQVHLLVAELQLSFLHVHARVEVVHVDKILGRRWVRCQLGQLVCRLEQYEGLVVGPRWVFESGIGIQSFEEGIPLLRRQLSYHWQHLFRQGKLHLELGWSLGSFWDWIWWVLWSLMVALVWPTGERHVWHHVSGVAWLRWILQTTWIDYQETARGNELLLRDVGEDSFCDTSFP